MAKTWFAFVPNLISLGRLMLAPLSVNMIVERRWPEALAIFLVAGLSDALDGWIARRFDLRSELGAYLDALADKALLVCNYVTLASIGLIPLYLATLVVSRDLMIVGAVILCWVMDKPMTIHPHFLSKANTAAQIAFVALLLGALAFEFAMPWFTAGVWLVAALTLASLAAYFRRWVAHMTA
ncbi:CDP-alcohol phosphatidyltransferase family protein [Rhodoblastus acidophilus]|uniref:CDP-diacylglycerol--glycerol-3-phosphate 3-phosphatidyltransferase n=1 Tax=Rhodoblastus acidophilus TaxID=1074 RepID=A0A6N8DVK2_RHOAC|nr:CDP-alcohol phosphatidyltransferase family protein [Rhodoblastus acidophilus]MCW2276092.1 cardiolipin synthase [Rhodoblastus acidophilus]MTV33181.1 CDP-alcohol phosphatidyltransferase family protein [Rhodoblastus acidophilus]